MHWNLLTVLESDLEIASRYIEFNSNNFSTYSTELSKLLLSSCSEIDVVMKEICEKISPAAKRRSINQWADIVNNNKELSAILGEEVTIDRFNLSFVPFKNWTSDDSPFWWKSYNKVKHERVNNFNKASLKNTLYAYSGLILSVFYLEKIRNPELNNKQLMEKLQPTTKLLKLNPSYYYETVVI